VWGRGQSGQRPQGARTVSSVPLFGVSAPSSAQGPAQPSSRTGTAAATAVDAAARGAGGRGGGQRGDAQAAGAAGGVPLSVVEQRPAAIAEVQQTGQAVGASGRGGGEVEEERGMQGPSAEELRQLRLRRFGGGGGGGGGN